MGRKRIPAEVRRLVGSRVRPEHEIDDTLRAPTGRPTMPDCLDDEGRREWRRMVPLLLAMNALAKVHRAALTLYCLAWSHVVLLARQLQADTAAAVAAGGSAADALVQVTPTGFKRPSATLGALQEAMAVCAKHLGDLGLSPTTQSRILATRGDEQLELPGVVDPVAEKLARLRMVR